MGSPGKLIDAIVSKLRRKLRYSLYRQKWNIGVTPYSAAAVAGLQGAPLQRQALEAVQWMPQSRSFFAADPFILPSAGKADEFKVLYEHFDWKSGLGRIDSVQFSRGRFGTPANVIDSPFHLSYPFVFSHDSRFYVLPEHAASKDLSIYDLGKSGGVGKRRNIHKSLALIDATILMLGGKYWIFATHAGPAENSELHIYFCDDLFGSWTAHAHNPVKRDKGNARPAGQIIHHEGEIFRPAQDCSSHYGSGIVVNRIKTLSEDRFEEEPVSEIRPVPGSSYDYGLHTLSSSNGCSVIDGARMESALHPSLDRWGRCLRQDR